MIPQMKLLATTKIHVDLLAATGLDIKHITRTNRTVVLKLAP